MANNANILDKVIFPDLSYKLVGAGFDVFNDLGWGLQEKYYQKALAIQLKKIGLGFKEQVPVVLKYGNEDLGRYFLDFVVADKIVLELKVINKLGYDHSRQLLGYLRATGHKLGILLYFTKNGVKYRRILNSEV